MIICTVFFGVLVGYALAQLQWRGRGVTFALALLVQVVPFQLLMIPLYVLIARDYGLSDNYLGMILPFAINSSAVIIFRQYFLQLPKDIFEAARIDGASRAATALERRVAAGASGAADGRADHVHRAVERVPLAVPHHEGGSLQPLAVSLANYISTIAASASNPFGATLAGAFVLAVPAVTLFIVFQRYFTNTDLGSGVKG